jgi:hypothetical protein
LAAEIIEEKTNTPTPAMGEKIFQLWNDTGIQEAYRQASKFQLLDSAA